MNEAVDGGERHRLLGEDLAPITEWLIGGDQQGAAFVASGHQLEQNAGLRLVLGDVRKVVEDQEMVAVEFGNGGFKGEVAACDLEPLHEIGGEADRSRRREIICSRTSARFSRS